MQNKEQNIIPVIISPVVVEVRASASTRSIKTVNHQHDANAGKLNVVHQTLDEYQNTAVVIANRQWEFFFKDRNGSFNKNLPINTPKPSRKKMNKKSKRVVLFEKYKITKPKREIAKVPPVSSLLSERYKQTIQYQICGTLDSYISNLKLRFVKMVRNSSIDDENTKMQLFYINKYKLWFKEEVSLKGVPVAKQTIKLARQIFHVLSKNKPRMNNINMVLDEKTAVLEKSDTDTFGFWLRMSNINPGKPIFVPIKSNKYFDTKYGTGLGILKHCVQVNRDKTTKEIRFGLISEVDTKFMAETLNEMGIDIGVRNVIATSYGEVCGAKLYNFLVKYDNITTKLLSNLQSNKIDIKTNKRYNRLIRKIRAFLKNEINRILNKLVERHRPSIIDAENLDFREPEMSREQNRLLGKFGLGIITKKLEQLEKDKGIQIIYHNPAHTSRECHKCGYTDKKNRKSRDEFECRSCGNKIHADVNASRTIKGRRSSPVTIYWKKEKVLDWLKENFVLRNPPAHPEGQVKVEKQKPDESVRRHSSAKDGARAASLSKCKVEGIVSDISDGNAEDNTLPYFA